MSGVFLEVEDQSAIRGGDAPFVDLLGREADVALPVIGSDSSLSFASSMTVYSSAPVVTAIGSYLAGGEYGVGQVIPTFICCNANHKIAVQVIRYGSLIHRACSRAEKCICCHGLWCCVRLVSALVRPLRE